MKLFPGFLLGLGLLLCGTLTAQQPVLPPAPDQFVTDASGFLRASTKQELARDLKTLEDRKGYQVIVWIGELPSGTTKEEFAASAMKAWGVGRKELNDGAVLFIFPAIRGLRIEVGYGLEDRLTDAISSRILREEVTPRLQGGDRDGAVRAAVQEIRKVLDPEGGPTRTDTRGARSEHGPSIPIILILLFSDLSFSSHCLTA